MLKTSAVRQMLIRGAGLMALIAVAAACGDGGSSTPAPTDTGTAVQDGSVAASLDEAEAMLGFDVILPQYVPEGFDQTPTIEVVIVDGEPRDASIRYTATDAPHESGASTLVIVERVSPLVAELDPDVVTIDGQDVYLNATAGATSAVWQPDDRVIVARLIGSPNDIDFPLLREEAIRVAESMIVQ